eukprot:CAMPEP_0117033138 /NCGR_PEP_ID=MMETSP0472-20121206/23709_1 /TAXON_ID=693140 ORGANISM="Tiarina fusus, Strain LIS" /NCGR_SAMPLE_ID=MMETSP0472 /ASSEMBLY_ACC=CAM_ASM_000603 /LENGTH=107 /DNA_ID=CAMNT_0004741989 /DNA_START=67 /DNA_END=390 /DNA_ORIENTATION=+
MEKHSKEVPMSTVDKGSIEIVVPPPGAPPGGIWGIQSYSGTKSQLCFAAGVITLVTLGFGYCVSHMDRRPVYWVNGVYYDERGVPMTAGGYFQPSTVLSIEGITMLR